LIQICQNNMFYHAYREVVAVGVEMQELLINTLIKQMVGVIIAME